MTELEEKRVRVATVERELSGLGIRHDLAMSAFKFDEARDVQQRIAVLEGERRELIDALPPPTEPPAAVRAPVTARTGRLGQRRRRLLRR
jgi:hypothetical protein